MKVLVTTEIKQNEKNLKALRKNRLFKILNDKYEKTVGGTLQTEISHTWESEKVLVMDIFSGVNIKDEAYDEQIKRLARHGRMRIERIEPNGNIIKTIVEGE